MPKNIVLCCDGTGNRFVTDVTNVIRLFNILDLDNPKRQIGYYHPGLGTLASPAALTRVAQGWTKLIGMAFGYGISGDIGDLYKFLMQYFEPGDRIFLFGFSRGAYTVRALAGMLHLLGLLRPGNDALVSHAVDLLKQTNTGQAFELAKRFKATFPRECKPYFIGVWDTVSSIGWIWDPLHVPYTARNPDLSIGRHAVSIDERRCYFRQNLWGSPLSGQDIKQVWFAGAHSDIGGGYPEDESGLAKISLEWMVGEAYRAGLAVKPEVVERVLGLTGEGARPDACAAQHDSLTESWSVLELFPHRYYDMSVEPPRGRIRVPFARRRFMPNDAVVHESVLTRKEAMSTYRAPNLPSEPRIEAWVRWEPRGTTASTGQRERSIQRTDFPKSLLDDLRSGDCVLYAGAGLSAIAGLPTWKEFAGRLVGAAGESGPLHDDDVKIYRDAITDGKTDYVVDELVELLPSDLILAFVRSTFVGMREIPQAYKVLAELPFGAVLTTNFDNLAERAFGFPPEKIRTPRDVQELLNAVARSESFLLQLYGTPDRPETLMLSPAQFDAAISANLAFGELIEHLFASRTILFVGCSLEGIEAYLRGVRLKVRPARQHFAISGVAGTSWLTMADVLDRRYSIQVIPYADGNGEELLDAVRSLRLQVGQSWRPAPNTSISPLQRIVLDKIGPFEYLDQPLDAELNIFIGDNGVGKSTILRAIAVALCGRHAQPYAGRLIRAGETNGSIRLHGGRGTYYDTVLQVGANGIELSGPRVTPIDAEGWLAFGFPPLRTTSGRRGTPAAHDGIGRPVVGDVLPLARGDADLRLDALQDWIIDLDYRNKDAISRGSSDNRYQRLLDAFFRIVGRLTEGVKIEFGGIDAATKRITVKTDDGDVPLEWVSQGTASLISWVGVILQRLYEIYSQDEDPTQRYFLVLMDEIDAHMHPKWQQIMLRRVRDFFPKMQLLATTHSNLMLAGLKSSQVLHVTREMDRDREIEGAPQKRVRVRSYEMSLIGLEADDILTSPLFGLTDTRDAETRDKQGEYIKLVSTPTPSDEAERGKLAARRAQLARELFGELNTAGREIQKLVDKATATPTEDHDRMLSRAEALIQKLSEGGNSNAPS